MQLKIALCQFKVTPEKAENFKTAEGAIEVRTTHTPICLPSLFLII